MTPKTGVLPVFLAFSLHSAAQMCFEGQNLKGTDKSKSKSKSKSKGKGKGKGKDGSLRLMVECSLFPL
ncbi:hypothetical protein [Yersinia similis]|uniref:hypothetical protein n=1 Tax=Yersinia similis TaxID=367190 RepID=UPI0018CD2FF2|nr:hypothetical protein [Yersinia similis]